MVLLGVVMLVVAAAVFLLATNARDFCDSTCNPGADHLWTGLSAIAALSSLVQIFAAANRSGRVALVAMAVTFLVLGIPLLLAVLFS